MREPYQSVFLTTSTFRPLHGAHQRDSMRSARRGQPRDRISVRRIPQTSRASPAETTLHPAHIPREVGGISRQAPGNPARQAPKRPAHVGNPRPVPLSPETPRPACHAGGRGFESRRSRRKHPANPGLLLSVLALTTAGLAPIPRDDLAPSSGASAAKTCCKWGCSVAGLAARRATGFGHPAQIPLAHEPLCDL
jgi:hypothetical protein